MRYSRVWTDGAGESHIEWLTPTFEDIENYGQGVPTVGISTRLPGANYALVIGDDADWDRMVDNFGKFCDNAAQYGSTAAIEAPVFSRKVNNLKAAIKLVADAGRKNAMISIDPYQFFRTGHTPADLDNIDPEIFSWTQMTDGLLDPPGFRIPGTGAVPLGEILDRLPPELLLSLECGAPKDSSYTPSEWAKIALEGTRKFLDGYYAAKK